jgi:thiamine biosynthesis lipoprotein
LGPGAFDPTGFVKGWATERAAEALTAAGLRHWSVEVGGDLVTRGQPTPDRLWHVAVRDPWRPAAVVAVLGIRDAAVATSGAYERGEHIWRRAAAEARDGDLAAVTVVGPHLAWADAFATAAFAMGAADRAIEWVASFAGYDALAVRAGGDLLASADFERHLAPPPTGPAGPENFPVFGNRASAAGKSQR